MGQLEIHTAYLGELFKVDKMAVAGRGSPYEFVTRVGSVAVMPVLDCGEDGWSVGTTHTQRYHYGSSFMLPGGNANGGFEDPEEPHETGLRELREELGLGYECEEEAIAKGQVHAFDLSDLHSAIEYRRSFLVVRNVTDVPGKIHTSHEVVTLCPMPLDDYLDQLLDPAVMGAYPEVKLAFMAAVRSCGRSAVWDWLVGAKNTGGFDPAKSFGGFMKLLSSGCADQSDRV